MGLQERLDTAFENIEKLEAELDQMPAGVVDEAKVAKDEKEKQGMVLALQNAVAENLVWQ